MNLDVDLKMLQYPPSVVAVAALWNVLEEKAVLDDNMGRIMNLFGQEHKVTKSYDFV